jgi:hypothetical protein
MKKRKRINGHMGCKVKKGVSEGDRACMRVCLGWVTSSDTEQDDRQD